MKNLVDEHGKCIIPAAVGGCNCPMLGNGIKFYVASPEDGGYCGSARVPSACKASVFQFRDVCLFLCFRLETHVVI